MKKKSCFKLAIAILLCCGMLLPYVPTVIPTVPAEAVAPADINNFDVGDDFQGLNLSVIGDSISTYDGYTNNKTYNPLYGTTTNATFGPYYKPTIADREHISVGDTWWMQTANALGMNLLVNNSWSGSRVMMDYADGQQTVTDGSYGYPAAGYKDRCVNLHNGTTNPDIIAVFLGTNDINFTDTYNTTEHANAIGTKADVDTASERSALFTSVNNYATPSTSIEAYYIMISRMVAKYVDAEIYCMSPMRHLNAMVAARKTALDDFNEAVKYICSLYTNVHFVDLDNDCGMTDDAVVKDYYYLNNLHPDTAGMDAISSCLVSEILMNSKKAQSNAGNTTGVETTYDVTYDLDKSFVTTGLARRAVKGKPFKVNLLPFASYLDVEIAVTMGGEDISIAATTGDTVYIPNVTGPIKITAKGDSNDYFCWVATKDDLAGVYGDGYTYNHASLTGVSDKYSSGAKYSSTLRDGVYVGSMNYTYHTLERSILLQHQKPWVVEFKMDSMKDNMLLMSSTKTTNTYGNRYLYLAKGDAVSDLVLIGTRDQSLATNLNYGAQIPDGCLTSNTPYIFRMYNVIEENGSNMVYISVGTDSTNMTEGAPLNNRYHGGTFQNETGNWVSGQDFVFDYFGTTAHALCANIEYIKVWENGTAPAPKTEFNDYRWELSEYQDDFISVDDDDVFTENYLNKLSGTIEDGEFTECHFSVEKPIVLMHDKPWDMEWISEGSWRDSNVGALLLSTSADYKGSNAPFLYRRHGSEIIAFGEWDNGQHNNYGVKLSDHGIDGTLRHKYRLSNVVNDDGSNMVYLYVDDVLVDAMNNAFSGGNDLYTKSDWISGKDFVFSYIGVSYFPIGNCKMEYLQIWEKGSFLYTLDTDRLTNLLDYPLSSTINGTDANYNADSWDAYTAALAAGKNLMNTLNNDTTQADIDAVVEDILKAQRGLFVDMGDEGSIYKVELLTGSPARINRQVGLRVITTPNITELQVGSETLIVQSCKTQTILIDGVKTVVKVWLVTFKPDVTEACEVQYSINALQGGTLTASAEKTIAFS